MLVSAIMVVLGSASAAPVVVARPQWGGWGGAGGAGGPGGPAGPAGPAAPACVCG